MRFLSAALVVSMVGASALSAQLSARNRLPAKQAGQLVEKWHTQIKSADALLREGKPLEARRAVDHVLRQMSERIEGGRAVGSLFAPALMVRALSHAAEGDTEEAAYDWSMVRSLDQRFTYPNLDLYKIPPSALPFAELEEIWQKLKRKFQSPETSAEPAGSPAGSEDVERPKKISGKAPVYPDSWRRNCLGGKAVIAAVIDEQGKVRTPAVLEGSAPAAYTSMEALRSWRFRPAMLEGKPVRVFYTLTINFETEACGGRSVGGAR